ERVDVDNFALSATAPPLVDDGGVTYFTLDRGAVALTRFPLDPSGGSRAGAGAGAGPGPVGEPIPLLSGQRQVTDFAAARTPAGTVVAAVVTDAASSGELVVLGPDGTERVVTGFGANLARAAALRPMEELAASAPDGYPVHGWVVKPAGKPPFPVLLVIHGGPFTQFGYRLFDEAQVYAGAGYAVVLGNPRGSAGYGEAHGRAIVGDFGNLDAQDLQALLDAALADPELDATRVGVMGGSYGGLMTGWLLGHSDRFRAGISERACNAFDSFEGSSDIGWLFNKDYIGTDPERVRAQSPLTYADSISAPVLIIHSEQDWRCPLEQAQRLFVALKQRGVETEMLLFPGEGHELSRSGLPSHRVARFAAILDWWERHLKPAE
ncbi:MAG TPA: prolyl oligopeptidase family serine peptidase, partial [Actinomycetota bacterium]